MIDPMDCAKKAGFTAAKVIDTDQITFDHGFLKYCEENLCGNYGANYSCPPNCGNPQEMQDRIMRFKHALVLQTVSDIADYKDSAAIWNAKLKHNAAMLELIGLMTVPALMCGASNCTLCDVCLARRGEPCAFPDKRWSCLSAYCINVSRLAEACGMDYSWNEGKLSLYGLIAW